MSYACSPCVDAGVWNCKMDTAAKLGEWIWRRFDTTVKIACVVFDCLDALMVGRFWSEAIGRPLDPEASSEFASIGFHERRDRAGWGPVERDADHVAVCPRAGVEDSQEPLAPGCHRG